MSVKKNILLNSFANIFMRLIRVAEQLLLVPFFLTAWGPEYYGEWITLTIIPSVLAFSDLGFGSAAGNSLVLSYSAGDKQRTFNIIHIGVRICTIAILTGCLISAVAMLVAYYTGLFAKSLIPTEDCIIALSLIMFSRLMTFYDQIVEAMYRAKRRAPLCLTLDSMRSLLSLVAGVLALYGGCGVVGFALAQLVAMLVSQIIRSVVGIRVFHETIRGQWSTEEAKNLVKRGLGFLCTPIWQSIYFQGTTFVVRVVLGTEAVAVFNTIRTVCRSVNQIFTIVSGSITPELQCEYGFGNLSTVQRVFRRALHFVAFVAIIGVAALGIVGRPLYAWWTHNTLLVPNSMWYIFMSGILFNALWWTAGTIFQVTNRPYRFALYGIVSASVSTLLTYVLSLCFGLSGAAMGYVLMDVLMFLLVIPTASSYLQLPLSDLWIGKCTCKTSVNA